MKHSIIQSFINSTFNPDHILSSEINISPINKQIDSLNIIFKEYENYDYTPLGKLLSLIDNYTTEQDYGDLTETDIKITTFHEIGDDLHCAIFIKFNIDS
jgi:hypothetical protein